ncbi:MAG: nickel pincer cofactor biosynthesis protein LarB [Deltaproteobacteria bacterium]
MSPEDLTKLLTAVKAGDVSVDDASTRLSRLPFEDLGFARIDHHRHVRTGYPEVVYGPGKTPEQIANIVDSIRKNGQTAIVTRVDTAKAETAESLLAPEHRADLRYDPTSRLFVVGEAMADAGRGKILVVAAGTSDLPVAEEAAQTAHLLGNVVERITDVGVAGLHRLLPTRERLEDAEVVIVVAGMEGALPSVVKGMISRPVIAVPTSVGFGASLGGIAALLGMLSSCSAGITVVNIDNGFGAGYAASLINRRRTDK